MSPRLETIDVVGRLAKHINLNGGIPAAYAPVGRPPSEFISPEIAEEIPVQTMHRPSNGSPTVRSVDLDLQELRKRGFLTSDSKHSLLAEEYRVIKRPLLREAFNGKNPAGGRDHTVLVTSSRQGEGKTFTSINLAMSVASEHDVNVLLIDGDVRRKDLSKTLGVSHHKGLMDVLSDPTLALSDVILRTNIPHLTILPAGQSVSGPTEMLASQKMKNLIDDITHRYPDRFIIFDSSPVMSTSEPGVLAAYVGQVIMVILANETTRVAIDESLNLVSACPNINFVLNKITVSSGPGRFGYYGSYDDQ